MYILLGARAEAGENVLANPVSEEEEYLNKTIDWSFNYHYKGKGQWFRNKDTVEVPDTIGAGVNDDNKHLAAESNKSAVGDADIITVKVVDD